MRKFISNYLYLYCLYLFNYIYIYLSFIILIYEDDRKKLLCSFRSSSEAMFEMRRTFPRITRDRVKRKSISCFANFVKSLCVCVCVCVCMCTDASVLLRDMFLQNHGLNKVEENVRCIAGCFANLFAVHVIKLSRLLCLAGKAFDNPGFSYLAIYISYISSLRCPVSTQYAHYHVQNNLGLVASIKLYKVLMKAILSNSLVAQQFFICVATYKSAPGNPSRRYDEYKTLKNGNLI